MNPQRGAATRAGLAALAALASLAGACSFHGPPPAPDPRWGAAPGRVIDEPDGTRRTPRPGPERPHQPWVFRSVLDDNARMLTAALAEDLWVAYDTTHASLAKAWSGGVDFDGPVYTTEHGPQPTSVGSDWIDPLAGARWRDADGTPLTVRWLGHRFHEAHVRLSYELSRRDGATLEVEETPATLPTDPPTLRRSFRLGSAEAGEGGVPIAPVLRSFGRPGHARRHLVETDGRYDVQAARNVHAALDDPDAAVARLELNPQGETVFTIRYLEPPPPPEPEPEPEPDPDAPEPPPEEQGEDVVDESGTAVADAEPAPDFDVPDESTLPHPSPAGETGPTEPGLAVRIYHLDDGLGKLLPLVPGQTPNVSVVRDTLDLPLDSGFGGLVDGPDDTRFVCHVSGWLAVDRAGRHDFRLVSDDGSRLSLGGTTIIDHDGLHATEAREGSAVLQPGHYALTVEHFENGGGESLQLSWRPPGTHAFAIVPREVLATTAGEVRVTSPGPKQLVRPLSRKRPGDGAPLLEVHPSFDLATVRPEGFEPRVGGMDFLPDGRLALCTWEADGAVCLLDGVTGDDPGAITVQRYAEGLAEPLGLRVVKGRIFVLQKQELTELIDHDGDGRADEYRCHAAGWPVSSNFHEFAFGLAYADNHFWGNLAVAIDPGGASTQPQVPGRGSVLRIDWDGGYEAVAHGLRTPNGIGFGSKGGLYVTDNQGDWLPVSKLLRVEQDAFYGNRDVLGNEAAGLPVAPPVVWLPQGEIGNSPSEPTPIWEDPWRGQMLHGDVTHGGLKRVFVEEVDGVFQGTVFRFSQGLEAGINRLAWGPDGALYVGGIGSTGNWGQSGKQRFGLQRLRPNGQPTFELLAVHTASDGLQLEFSEPLAPGLGWTPAEYELTQWRYEPTGDYGGPKLDLAVLDVLSASVSEDRRRVFLHAPGIAEQRVVHVRLAGLPTSERGATLWSPEAWVTLNRLPTDRPGTRRDPPPLSPANVLSDGEQRHAFQLLFDGVSTEGWRGFRRPDMPPGWEVVDGTLSRTGGGGDIITEQQFSDFELRLQWRISERGNSGIFFHVTEDHDWVWETGPEMQVLDNTGHADGASAFTSAGANYALHAPEWDVTRPVGSWNDVRLVVREGHVEHWLNGFLLLSYELGSEDWERTVAESKFASMPDYGRRARGHIALQDHGDLVAYRNIRVRHLRRR